MKQSNRFFTLFILLALLAVSLGVTAKPAAAAGPYVCIPTCTVDDGRMLSLASVGYETLAGQTISVKISVPGTMPTFELGIFDGDTSGTWDAGSTPLTYTLYADPLQSGATSISMQVAQWTGGSMADNAWTDLTIPQDTRAQAPSGDYFYHMHVDLPNAATVKTWSNFKIRSNTPVELATNESFAYAVPLFTSAETNILYPQGPWMPLDPNTWTLPTTYDGTWDLYFYIPTSIPYFVIWDGDMDYGAYDCSVNDTNDPDTPDGVLPSWALGISDVPEGVASSTIPCRNSAGQVITGPEAQIYATGNPVDDHINAKFRRSPSVTYDVIDPNGNVYTNANPSGNLEWEQFRIDSDPNTAADYHVSGLLPAGIYKIHMSGLDISNLNAWHPSYDEVCVHDDGTPCVPVLHSYKIGDTVWKDANGNGLQDGSEAGIPGVTVTLLDSNGNPIPGGTAVTDANGLYSFKVDPGTYKVQVDASNFSAGGALAGYVSTTGGEVQTNTVTNADVMTYDFGYWTASIGNFVWNDLNGNGLQEGGEPGLSGVAVTLLGSDGTTVLGNTTTDASGLYSFTNLLAGTYSVQFSVPSGFIFTTKNAGSDITIDSNANTATGKTDPITLAAGATDNTIDAGLKAGPGCVSRRWNFNLPTGNQGMSKTYTVDGLMITAYGFNNNGTPTALYGKNDGGDENGVGIASDGDHEINLTNFVQIDLSNVIANGALSAQMMVGSVQSGEKYNVYGSNTLGSIGDLLGPADRTLDNTFFSVPGFLSYRYLSVRATAANVLLEAVSFNCGTASLGDKVWKDVNSNGLQDSGEAGLSGVTVTLLGSDGTTVLGTTTSDANGIYSFTGLPAGTYTVQFSAPSGYTFTTQYTGSDVTIDSNVNPSTGKTDPITLAAGATDNTIDAGLKGPVIWSCPNNLVLNPSFELNTGSPPKNWTNGTAGYIGIPAVDGINVGYISGSGTMSQKINVVGGNSYTLTFYSGSHVPSIQTVKIQYFTSGNAAIGSASVHTITSDLEITGFGGPYTLTLDAAPANAATLKIMVSANNKDYAKVDALCLQATTPPATASIGDFVWNDANGNGIQDSGEPGISNVTVNLLGSDGTTVLSTKTTDASGFYSFSNLLAGTYYVQFTAPSGYTFTTKNASGSTAANDSNVNPSTGKTDAITLATGATDNTIDAGLYQPASIGDFVWKDVNGNGIQDAGEPGISNVTVKLLGSDGTTVLGTKTTNANGIYSFTNLLAGTYYVQFTAPSGFTFTTKNAAGSTIANDSNADPSTGKTDTITLAAGATDNTIDAGLKPAVNYCAYIRTPGFWKNYSNHMSKSTFLNLISHTQDFSTLTVNQAVTILSTNNGKSTVPGYVGVDATFLKFLLTSEINAVWNGNDNAAALGGLMGTGIYQGTGKTVNQLLGQAYLDRKSFSSDENAYVLYLGSGGEGVSGSKCLVQP
jgi:protocatechuate 3,4-dioxygenase beta subunit